MSIAYVQFARLAGGHVIGDMQTISETRLTRLAMLVKKHGGSLAALNEAIGLDRTDRKGIAFVRNVPTEQIGIDYVRFLCAHKKVKLDRSLSTN